MSENKKSSRKGVNMDVRRTDKIKSSLGSPTSSTRVTGLHSTTPKGKNFMPKGFKK